MQPLPLVDCADGVLGFVPVSDASIVVLARILLEAGAAESPAPSLLDELGAQLANDPALAIWVVWSAQALDAFLPKTLGEAALWVFQNASQLPLRDTMEKGCATQGAAGALPSTCPVGIAGQDPGGQGRDSPASWPPSAEEAERLGTLVANRVTLAELATRLAAAQFPQPETADQARLAGLVFCPAEWDLPERLQGLAGTNSEAVKSVIQQAAAIVTGQASPSDPRTNLPAISAMAGEVKRRWLASIPGIRGLLPALAVRLAEFQELRKLRQEFLTLLEREKLDALAEFAAGAGHEINNPLANISGRAQLLLRSETNPERRRDLATIVAQAQRAHQMIADLWLFARPPQPELQRLDLVELVEQVVAEAGALASGHSVELVRTGRRDPLWLQADPVQLHVAVGAVVTNAIEAVGCEGRVEVAVEFQGHEVSIRVTDNGPGIPAEVRRHLFDPFFSGRQAGRGLGLGLSKAWRIARNHGGRIEVAHVSHGASLVIVLPINAAEIATERSA